MVHCDKDYVWGHKLRVDLLYEVGIPKWCEAIVAVQGKLGFHVILGGEKPRAVFFPGNVMFFGSWLKNTYYESNQCMHAIQQSHLNRASIQEALLQAA